MCPISVHLNVLLTPILTFHGGKMVVGWRKWYNSAVAFIAVGV